MHPRERIAYSAIDRRPPLRLPEGLARPGVAAWDGTKILDWHLAQGQST